MKYPEMKYVVMSLLTFLSSTVFSQTPEKGMREFEKLLYGDLKQIKYFGFIGVYVEGTDFRDPNAKNDIGLSSQELTDFLRLRFKNNFANIRFKAPDDFSKLTESQKTEMGRLWCGVWTVGTKYPVAYHVECQIGTFKTWQMQKDASLGLGNENVAKEEIRKSLDRMVTDFAQTFFRVRDEI